MRWELRSDELGGEEKKQKQSTRERDDRDQETGRKKCWKGG